MRVPAEGTFVPPKRKAVIGGAYGIHRQMACFGRMTESCAALPFREETSCTPESVHIHGLETGVG